MSHATDEQQQAEKERFFAVAANVSALRLQLSSHAFDRSAAPAAYEVALAHHAAYKALTGRAGVA